MIGEIASLITAVIAVFGVYTYFKDSRRKAQQATLEAYTVLQNSTLSKINLWSPSEIREAAEDKQSDGYKELESYLAEIEHFCVGINEEIYDFETFYQLAHGYFDSDRGKLKPRLLPLLKVKLENANEDYFSNLHKVWERMDRKNAG